MGRRMRDLVDATSACILQDGVKRGIYAWGAIDVPVE